MPVEQHTGTNFSDGDQLDFHQARPDLRSVEEIQHTAGIEEETRGYALERAKTQTSEFFRLAQKGAAVIAQRKQKAEAGTEKPLDSQIDLGTNERYELT